MIFNGGGNPRMDLPKDHLLCLTWFSVCCVSLIHFRCFPLSFPSCHRIVGAPQDTRVILVYTSTEAEFMFPLTPCCNYPCWWQGGMNLQLKIMKLSNESTLDGSFNLNVLFLGGGNSSDIIWYYSNGLDSPPSKYELIGTIFWSILMRESRH